MELFIAMIFAAVVTMGGLPFVGRVLQAPEGDNTGSGGTDPKPKVKRLSSSELEGYIDGSVQEAVESRAEEIAKKSIEILVKTSHNGFTEMVKGIARETLSGDMDSRNVDAAMRVKHALENDGDVAKALRQARGDQASTDRFHGMKVAKHAQAAAIMKSGMTDEEPVVGDGNIGGRVLLHAMKARLKSKHWGWEDVRKEAKAAGDKVSEAIISKRLEQGTFTQGGSLIPEVTGDIIGMLHGMTALRSTEGAAPVSLTFADGQDIKLPRMNSGVTARWAGEAQSVNASRPSTDAVKLTERKLKIVVIQTEDFLRHVPGGAETMIRDDMRIVAREAEEIAGFRGDGSQNEPMGLRHLMSSDNRDIDRQQDGSQSTLQEIIGDLFRMQESVHGAGNDVPRMRPAYFLQHRTFNGLQAMVTNQDQLTILAQMLQNRQLFTVPTGVTTQLPEDLDQDATGNAIHTELYYVDMGQFIIADGIDARVDEADQATVVDGNGQRIRLWDEDCVALKLTLTTDFALRRAKAAASLKNVDWGAKILGLA